METKVSVIVPIFNVERYINRCVQSILAQSLYDIEIILVDDGSSDRGGLICDEYSTRDQRIRVIHQANKGLSDARNAGLDIACGDYIMFVDGDDWVEQDFCRIPYEIASQNDADVVVFRYSGDEAIISAASNPPTCFAKEEAVRYIYHNQGGMAWNKLYRKTMLTSIRFMSGRYYEDGPFMTEVIRKMEKVFFTDSILYHFCYRQDSITHTARKDIANDYYEMSSLTSQRLEELGFMDVAEKSRLEFNWMFLVRYGRSVKYARECIAFLRERKARSFQGRKKWMHTILKISPWAFDCICVLWGKRMKLVD